MVSIVLPSFIAFLAFLVWKTWFRKTKDNDLAGRVVLLTGAGGGLGSAMGRELARRGCRLALADIAEEPLMKTLEVVRLAASGAQDVAKAYVVDLGRRESIDALVEDVVRDFGRVHILVSNAAILTGGLLESYSDDTVDAIFDVNLLATVRLCRALVPRMRVWGGGQLAAISSMAAMWGVQSMTLYCSTKAGLTRQYNTPMAPYYTGGIRQTESIRALFELLFPEGRHSRLAQRGGVRVLFDFMESLSQELKIRGDPIDVTIVHPSFMTTVPLIQSLLELLYKRTSLVRYLVPAVSPLQSAKRVVSAIANREFKVFIPDRMSFTCNMSRLLPQWAIDGIMVSMWADLILPSMPPPDFRHRRRTAKLLRDMLEAGYVLLEDPADMLRELQDLPRHELQSWKPHAAALRGYYSSRNRPVPTHVLLLLQEMESEGAS